MEQALKSLQRKIQRDAIVREIKAAKYHEKPSIKRKRKREECDRRRRKMHRRARTEINYRNFVLFPGEVRSEPVAAATEEAVA